jgi:hypothetical protein
MSLRTVLTIPFLARNHCAAVSASASSSRASHQAHNLGGRTLPRRACYSACYSALAPHTTTGQHASCVGPAQQSSAARCSCMRSQVPRHSSPRRCNVAHTLTHKTGSTSTPARSRTDKQNQHLARGAGGQDAHVMGSHGLASHQHARAGRHCTRMAPAERTRAACTHAWPACACLQRARSSLRGAPLCAHAAPAHVNYNICTNRACGGAPQLAGVRCAAERKLLRQPRRIVAGVGACVPCSGARRGRRGRSRALRGPSAAVWPRGIHALAPAAHRPATAAAAAARVAAVACTPRARELLRLGCRPGQVEQHRAAALVLMHER